jgi:hypothetical protein
MQSKESNANVFLFVSGLVFLYALSRLNFETKNPWREELFPISPLNVTKESNYIIGTEISLSCVRSMLNQRDTAFLNAVAYISFSEMKHAYETYLEHVPSLARELYKFTFIYRQLEQNQQIYYYNGVLFSDFEHLLGNYISVTHNHLVHDSMMVVRSDQREFFRRIIRYLVDIPTATENKTLMPNHDILFREWMYNVIKDDSHWIKLPLVCDEYKAMGCPPSLKYCCQVLYHPSSAYQLYNQSKAFVLATEIATTTATTFNSTEVSLPISGIIDRYDDLPYITTLSAHEMDMESTVEDRTIFKFLESKENCLPIEENCSFCLKRYGLCSICKPLCKCFCDTICTEVPREQEQQNVKLVLYSTPKYVRDHRRLIPRIVHQTWHESVTKDKYPNLSRFAESWKQFNWEYKFWSDQDASDFISMHFPHEVKEAYDALSPGAFRADLFRYCVLFIHGGVYADIDILSESSLDLTIPEPNNIGFMIPLDVGTKGIHGTSYCLWNGLIFSAPGHPFLAMAIQNAVNRINNRFTSVDHMQSLCTNDGDEIDYTVSHRHDVLFFTGPCILGTSINRVLGRSPQAHFSPGDQVDIPLNKDIPGSFVILSANTDDMGAHRFTLLEKNMLLASTDMEVTTDQIHIEAIIQRKDIIKGIEGVYTHSEPKKGMVVFRKK